MLQSTRLSFFLSFFPPLFLSFFLFSTPRQTSRHPGESPRSPPVIPRSPTFTHGHPRSPPGPKDPPPAPIPLQRKPFLANTLFLSIYPYLPPTLSLPCSSSPTHSCFLSPLFQCRFWILVCSQFRLICSRACCWLVWRKFHAIRISQLTCNYISDVIPV